MGRPKGSKNTFSTKIKYFCVNCSKEFLADAHRIDVKFCCHKCYSENLKGKPSKKGMGRKITPKIDKKLWRGGRINKEGYIFIYSPQHPNAINGKYVAEHRLVVEKHLGRYLAKEEVIHHINENRSDNRIENLYVCSQKEHAKLHKRETNNKGQFIKTTSH